MTIQELVERKLAENKDFSVETMTNTEGVVFDVLTYKGQFINSWKQGDWLEANRILNTVTRIIQAYENALKEVK